LLYAPAKVTIPPSQEYIVSAAQAGLVSKLNVTIGDSVEKDQILALINSPELLSLQRQLLRANSEKRLAWAGYQRDKKLVQEGVISDRRWQESRNRYSTFRAEADEARQLLEIAGMSDKDIKKLTSSRRLTSQLAIHSPIQGVVLEKMVVAGERLDILAPLYRIANLEQLWLEINIPQEQMKRIKMGDKVLIENSDITATINLLGQSVNAQNHFNGAIVVVENIITHLADKEKAQRLPRLHIIYRATKEVATSVTSGTLIIIIVFLPLLTLQGLEGKLFTPVALTIVFALSGSLILSLTVIPGVA